MFRQRSILTLLAFLLICVNTTAQRHGITLQLKWWHQFQFAGYYAAQKEGYYARKGLQVRLIPGDTSHVAIKEVLDRRADFGVADCEVLTDFERGKPLVALGAVFQHSPYTIISLSNNRINTPAQLIGKSIMASENQGWVELKAMFLKEGIDPSKITVVKHSWNNQDLISGRVDAMSGYISVEPFQLKQQGVKPSYLLPINYGVDFYGDILFTSRDYADKHPEIVEQFKEASFQGWEYAMRHKEEICDYILTLPGVAERHVTKAALLYEAGEMEKLIHPELVEIGHMNAGRWEAIQEMYKQLGLIPADSKIDGFLYEKKPGLLESIRNIGFVVMGSFLLLFLVVLLYSIIVARAVRRKTKEQRQALDALRSSEERYRTLVDQAADGIAICNKEYQFIQVNPALLELFGYTGTEFYQMTLLDILEIDETDEPLRINDLEANKSVLSYRRARRKDGSTLIVEIHSTTLPSGNYLGFVRDITEKKQAEDKLLQQERQLDLIYNKVTDCIFVLSVTDNDQFSFISINQAFIDVTGIQRSAIIGKNITDVIPAPSLPLVIAKYKEAIKLKKTLQWEEQSEYPTGKKTGIVSVTPVFEGENCVQLIGSVHDISETKELQVTLDKIYRLSRIGAWELDIDSGKVFWSAITREIHETDAGFEPDLHTGIDFYKQGESRKKIKTVIERAMKSGIPFSEELQIVTAKGNDRWIRVIGEAEQKDGKWSRIYGSLQDINDRKNAEIAFLQALEERNTILESIGDGFFAVDKKWVVTYWNGVAEKMLETPKEMILNQVLWDIFSQSVDSESYRQYQSAMDSGKAGYFEDFYPVLNKWFAISVYPSVNGLSVYFKDITERKRAEEEIRISNERYLYVTKATNDCIWDWDMVTNNVVRASENYKRIFGYDAAAADQDNNFWVKHVHPDDLERVEKRRNVQLADPGLDCWEDEYRFMKADGVYAYIFDKGYIIRDEQGKAIRMIGSVSDISQRKTYEESLKQLNADLAKSNRDLAASNAEMEQFAYVASHDLQEPLRMVTSFLTQLEKKYASALDQKAKRYIYFAVDGAKRMRQIILDLLDFSRVGRTEDSLEAVDLNQLVDEILALYAAQIEEKKANISVQVLPVMTTYKAPVRQVFQNLISNSLKYSSETKTPEIRISARESGSFWEFSVADNGIGIEEAYFDKIFVIFQRLHNAENYSGTGLGLSITKKIIENLGGKIWVESDGINGSVFYFTMLKEVLS